MPSPLKKTPTQTRPRQSSTRQLGAAAESQALEYLERAGLRLLTRNYRTPGRGGGEIDLILLEPDGTVVFIEVRQRQSASHGGAAASVSASKQRRIVFAARHYLMQLRQLPPCRFDVVTLQDDELVWLRAAFDAPGY